MTERNFQIGGGPFQPQANADLEALRGEVNDLTGQLNDSKAEVDRLRSRLADYVSKLRIEYPDDLSKLLSYALSEYGPEVFVDADDEELTIRIPGLTIRDGEIAAVKRVFEVTVDVSFEITAQIEADDEDHAQEIFRDALDEELPSFDINIERYARVESSYTTQAELGRVDVTDVSF